NGTRSTYTVTFDSNGGSPVASQIVPHGSTTTLPAAPTRPRYTYCFPTPGASDLSVYNFATPVTADITLFAKWTLNNYTVTFNSNGGSAVGSQIVAYGSTEIGRASRRRTGYTFGGGCSDAGQNNMYNCATPVTANITR